MAGLNQSLEATVRNLEQRLGNRSDGEHVAAVQAQAAQAELEMTRAAMDLAAAEKAQLQHGLKRSVDGRVKTLEAELKSAQARIAEHEAQAKRYEAELKKVRAVPEGSKDAAAKNKLMPCCADKKTASSKNKEVSKEAYQELKPVNKKNSSAPKQESRREGMWQIGSLQEEIKALQEQLAESADINKGLLAELEKVPAPPPLATHARMATCSPHFDVHGRGKGPTGSWRRHSLRYKKKRRGRSRAPKSSARTPHRR